MQLRKYIIFFTLLLLGSTSFALLPPPYLSVPNWKQCIDTYQKGSANFVCLPSKKPYKCPKSSWRELKLNQLIEACPK